MELRACSMAPHWSLEMMAQSVALQEDIFLMSEFPRPGLLRNFGG
jgi:hypothetical protein